MESIDRLRDWLKGRLLMGNGWNELNEIADAIESEVKANRVDAYTKGYDEGFASADDWVAQHEDAMAEHGWVRLPLDAEGVPIRVGDVVERTDPQHHPSEVMSMVLFGDGDWQVHVDESQNVHASYQPKLLRHYHAPTVEDVLKDFIDAWAKWKDGAAMMNPVETFAAKLRLAEEGDE